MDRYTAYGMLWLLTRELPDGGSSVERLYLSPLNEFNRLTAFAFAKKGKWLLE